MRILISGASKGIGYETALHLAEQKGNQVLALARNESQLQDLQAKASKGRLSILPMDLKQLDTAALGSKIDQMGGLDILINNAGLLIKKPFAELSMEDWQQSMQVNFLANVQLIKTCLPYLEKSEYAHILNIGSMGGFQGSAKYPGLAAYSASKAALANLTECLAKEFSSLNIAVNCLSLGAVQTEMLETAFPNYKAPVTSEEMGAFIAYFSTHGQKLFNGKIIPVNLSNP